MSSRITLATMYGVGLTRVAPGTAGSAVAAILAFGILQAPFGWGMLFAGAILFSFLGTKSSTRYMATHRCEHDPSEIIIDELAGQWLTYSIWHGWLFIIAGSGPAAIQLLDNVAATPLFLVAGFLLFRLFDILKPWPISWADRKVHGGFGVMLDDLIAAIPAGTALYALYLFSPLLTGTMGYIQ